MIHYVYILKCKDNSLYTGMTNNLERRLKEHMTGKGGRYTRSKGVIGYVYVEQQENRSGATKREAEIKKFSRKNKLALFGATL